MKKVGNRFTDRTGENYTTNEGYEIEIIEYRGALDCDIQFEDGTILREMYYDNIRKGAVKNPYHPTTHGVGFIGIGKYVSSTEDKHTKNYKSWGGVLERCYSKELHKKRKTYVSCYITEEWKCFQNFAKWFEKNYNPETMQGWELDKDILIKGNKVYSPETCCFVPQEINCLFTNCKSVRGKYPIGVTKTVNGKYKARINKNGDRIDLGLFDTPEEAFQAYKIAKEEYIKEVADLWRGQITEPCYYAMYAYEVEITD